MKGPVWGLRGGIRDICRTRYAFAGVCSPRLDSKAAVNRSGWWQLEHALAWRRGP